MTLALLGVCYISHTLSGSIATLRVSYEGNATVGKLELRSVAFLGVRLSLLEATYQVISHVSMHVSSDTRENVQGECSLGISRSSLFLLKQFYKVLLPVPTPVLIVNL